MNILLRILFLISLAVYFTACAQPGGSDAGAAASPTPTTIVPHVPDSTPHDYQVIMARGASGTTGGVRILMVCDFGLSTAHTYDTGTAILSNSVPTVQRACSNAKNVTITVYNLDAVQMIYEVSVDSVVIVNSLFVPSGQSITFQRGF